jgi:hypothetical protein
LLGGFATTIHNLGKPRPQLSVVIDFCKTNVFERKMPESIEDFRLALVAVLEVFEELFENVFVQVVPAMLASGRERLGVSLGFHRYVVR